MTTKYEVSVEDLRNAADAFRKVDATDVVAMFDKAKIENIGLHVAVRFNPRDKNAEPYVTVDASRCESTDEYFSEHGPASTVTLLSGSSCETPGPGDGYEWGEDEDGDYYGNDSGKWFCEDRLEEECEKLEGYDDLEEGADLEEFAKSHGYYRFSVSSIPVDPDWSCDAEPVQEMLDELAKACDDAAEGQHE